MKNTNQRSPLNKVFSYSLFEAKSLPQHRYWDNHRNRHDRYWYNILSLALTNSILFPEYTLLFHVSTNIWGHPLSKVLKLLEDHLETFKIQTINLDYNLTEPAIWRMMPLWSRDIDLFHTRDVDSLPSINELIFINAFEKSDCTIGTIRSHKNHYGIACRMLAGLSSFKPQHIPLEIKGLDFNHYYSHRHNNYGSDQDLMVKFFTNNHEFTETNFFDYRIDDQNNKQDFSCTELDDDKFNLQISPLQQEVCNNIKAKVPTTWLGEPCDSRGAYTSYILSHFEDLKEKINENRTLREFYCND